MMPALRTSPPCSSRPSTADISPGWKASSWAHGFRRPVTSTTAVAPRCSRVPVGSASSSTPRVVTFSPMSPARTAKPAADSSSCSSACTRCTWRRLGWAGSRATRERCFTVAPACASPSTPSPASRRMVSRFRLLKVWPVLTLTAVTTPSIAPSFAVRVDPENGNGGSHGAAEKNGGTGDPRSAPSLSPCLRDSPGKLERTAPVRQCVTGPFSRPGRGPSAEGGEGT